MSDDWGTFRRDLGGLRDAQDAAYEESVVQQILKLLRRPPGTIDADRQRKLAELTTELAFPAALAALRHVNNIESLDADFEKRPTKTDPYGAWCEVFGAMEADGFEETSTAAVVFPWVHRSRFHVLSNRFPADLRGHGRFFHVEGRCFLVEPLAQFVAALCGQDDLT